MKLGLLLLLLMTAAALIVPAPAAQLEVDKGQALLSTGEAISLLCDGKSLVITVPTDPVGPQPTVRVECR